MKRTNEKTNDGISHCSDDSRPFQLDYGSFGVPLDNNLDKECTTRDETTQVNG